VSHWPGAAFGIVRFTRLRYLSRVIPFYMHTRKAICLALGVVALVSLHSAAAADWTVYEGKTGPGRGKHIVFLAGDEEYRSEEALPMLAKILAVRHGFKCTVLFPISPADGTIDPITVTNIPGMEALDRADLCVMALRFRELPDEQMKHFDAFLNAGKPIIGLRTSTHAFSYERNKASAYARYDWRNREWPGGFGQQVLGDTWVDHHGSHGKESTRGVINDAFKDHPLLRGVTDIWGPTDVYTIKHLPSDAKVLVWGQVLTGMKPEDPPVKNAKNDPMMPLVWTRQYTGKAGKTSTVVTTTMGAAVDLESEGLRRLLVNACYWTTGLADQIPARANVDYVGPYKPLYFGFGKHAKGVKPADLALP
jgi:type 1 glutamine amidotransferase